MTTLLHRDKGCSVPGVPASASKPGRPGQPLLVALALAATLPLAVQPSLAQSTPPAAAGAEDATSRPMPPPPALRAAEGAGVVVTDGEARRRLPSTVSDASVSIEVRAPDVAGTGRQLAERAQRLLDYLRAQGADRLRTESASFQPEMQEVRGQPDRVKNYLGRTTLSFRTTPDRLPALLSGSLDNGATGLLQSGAGPREEEVEAARQDLLAGATRAAMTRARAVAAALGSTLGTVERIEVDADGSSEPIHPAFALRSARMAAPAQPMPMEAGETEVSVRVGLTVRLVPGVPQR